MRSCPGALVLSAHARRSRARRAPFSSAHLLRWSDSAFVDLPCTYDRRQRLPRRLLHSRAPSLFSLVSLSLSTTSSTVSPFPTSTAVSVSPVVFSIPELRRRFPLSLSLSTTSSLVAPFPTSTAMSVSLVVFSIPGLRRRFPLSSSPFSGSVSVSPVVFSIHGAFWCSHCLEQKEYISFERGQLFPLRLRCCLELASSPVTMKLFIDRTLS
ncbi:hypothetical protein ACLOJK_008450 [Asimina triloba]